MEPTEPSISVSQARVLQCEFCDASFKRREHLERHSLRHSGVRPFTCRHCSKRFSRRDALQRHEVGHDGVEPLTPASTVRQNQACSNCALAKQKCSGGNPCARCDSKKVSCSYPTRSVSSISSRNQTQRDSEMGRRSINSVSLDTVESATTPIRGLHRDNTLDSITFDDWALTSLPVSEPMTIDSSSSYRTGPDNGSNCHSRDQTEDTITTSNPEQDFFNLPWLTNSGLSYNTLFWGTDYTNNIYRGAYPLPVSMNIGNTHPELAASHNAEPLQNQQRSSMQTNESSIPAHFIGHNCGPFQAASFEIPPLSADDENVIHADLLGHVGHTPEDAYQKLAEFYAGRARSPFIGKLAFQTFLDLFCEHFSGQFSFIHPTLLEDKDMSWVLLLAIGAVGAQYSALKQATLISGMLQDLLIDAVKIFCPGIPSATDVTCTQIILLRDICLEYNGGKRFHFERQYDKNRLITFARALRTDPQEPLLLVRQMLSTSPVKDHWKLWIGDECRVRLLHSIYYLECLQLVFHDIQPLLELVDLTSELPCPDQLWKCSSETEWKHALANCQQQGLSSNRAPQVGLVNPQPPEGYMRKLSFVYLYTEERLAIKRFMSPTFRDVLFPATLTTLNRQKQQKVDPKEAIASMRDHVASELNVLYPMNEQDLSPLLAPRNQEIIFTLLRLLRYIPMGNLLALSGWQASDTQIETAKLKLIAWVRQQPHEARQCLILSLTIFGVLRSKSHFAAHDAHSLLTATLYIWSYDLLTSGETITSAPSSSRVTIRLQSADNGPVIERWLKEGQDVNIHIPGVGVLCGKDSRSRLLHELRKILLSRTEWSRVCQAIALGVSHMIQKRRPRFEEDVTPVSEGVFDVEGRTRGADTG